ncbi:MAG: hypothetical protein CVV63_02930 [Tenericutes bacterium HGW-Tenericutes-8]|nr:MAG: hypothetical protein CVV63_02930 [Tenericutes bacterium HGW-Tenericutes-8]
MAQFLGLLGILTVVFIVLASVNGLKRYTKLGFVKALSKQHKLFGMIATTLAFVHLIIALSLGELRLTGALALTALLVTGLSGMLFFKLKKKNLYIVHRIAGPVAFILIIIHIIFNSNF